MKGVATPGSSLENARSEGINFFKQAHLIVTACKLLQFSLGDSHGRDLKRRVNIKLSSDSDFTKTGFQIKSDETSRCTGLLYPYPNVTSPIMMGGSRGQGGDG